MKKLLAGLLLIVAAILPATAGTNEDGSVTIVLPAEVVKACAEQGGCRIVTRDQFYEAVKETIEQNKSTICGKDA